MNVHEYDTLRPSVAIKVDNKKIRFNTLNRQLLWRVETLFSKEPSTITWLERLNSESILVDVGANVGMYSIYASVLKGARVYAFEPESQNYATLTKNILSNNIANLVTAFPICLSDEIKLDVLHLSEFIWNGGGSCHSFGEEVGFDLQPRSSPFSQGSISYTLDKAISERIVAQPTHIKIDVDGFEHKVLNGASHTLKNNKLKSICIEINPNLDSHIEAVKELNKLGFFYSKSQVQQVERKEGAFKGCAEYIFDRLSDPKIQIFTSGFKVLPEVNSYHQTAKDHALNRIDETQVETYPFPYIIVDNIFPDSYYEKILSSFPSIEISIPLGETGRVTEGSYPDRKVTLFNDQHFSNLDKEKKEFWEGFASWLYSPDFINKLIKNLLHGAPIVLHNSKIKIQK